MIYSLKIIKAANSLKKALKTYTRNQKIQRAVKELVSQAKLVTRVPRTLNGNNHIINFYKGNDGTLFIEAVDLEKGRIYETSTTDYEDMENLEEL